MSNDDDDFDGHRPRRTPRPATGRKTAGTASVPAAVVETLVRENLALVGHIVRETMTRLPAHIGRDDLTSAGMAALVLSAQGYDESRGVPFARFAAIRIRGALVDELRSMDWASRSVRGRAREVDAARNQLSVTLGRSPRPHEVAETLGCQRLGAWQHRCRRASGQRAEPAGLRARDRRGHGARRRSAARSSWSSTASSSATCTTRSPSCPSGCATSSRPTSSTSARWPTSPPSSGVTESRISQLRAEALKLLRHGLAAAEPEMAPAPEPTGRAGAKIASYAAAVAARGTLSTRLQMSNSEFRPHGRSAGHSSIA